MEEAAINYIKSEHEFRFESRMLDKSHIIEDVKGDIEDLYEELKEQIIEEILYKEVIVDEEKSTVPEF